MAEENEHAAEELTADDAPEMSAEDRAATLALWKELLAIDKAARSQGHSLPAILIKSARDAFGIDVRPADPEPQGEGK